MNTLNAFKPTILRTPIIPNQPITSKQSNPKAPSGIILKKLAASLKSARANSRTTVMVTAGIAAVAAFLLMEEKAMALGPEGPLVEEFWDNMRRYGLYALTVSSGAIWALLEPIVELLKNPVSALLVLIIFGGGFFVVSQVVTAMVGLSDFSYQYGN